LAACRGRRVLVVGDLMLDRYVHGRVDRISPEAPVPVVLVTREHSVPGGACNVAANIAALGGRACLSGIVGDDAQGRELLGLLEARGVDLSGVLVSPEVPTITKTRVLAERQQVVRVDRESDGMDRIARSPAFTARLESALRDVDGAIVEDYGKGVIQQPVVDLAAAAARSRRIPVGYDPKDNHLRVEGLGFGTPNRREALHCAGLKDRTFRDPAEELAFLEESGRALLAKWKTDFLVVTLGPLGMMVIENGRPVHHVHTRAREVYDVSGAGDTVIATCTLALAAGAGRIEAAELANFAAGVVVAKIGTATCSPGELLDSVASHD
ncbi:MAG: PfkB family carbohydrate kinase, partial [Kiritimatiellia bacterium]